MEFFRLLSTEICWCKSKCDIHNAKLQYFITYLLIMPNALDKNSYQPTTLQSYNILCDYMICVPKCSKNLSNKLHSGEMNPRCV